MAWSASKYFQAYFVSTLNRDTNVMDTDADTIKVALFDNSGTPDRTVSAANSAYGAGVWAAGGVFDASGWPAVGRNLASVTSSASAGTYTFDAADTVSANSTTTLASTYGCLVYDDTSSVAVADQGICFNYFGGANSVTSGTFTIVWNASGIGTVTV